jgi:methylase of polypeptide subunit release factors
MYQPVQFEELSESDTYLLRILEGLETAEGVFKPNASSVALAECVRGLSGSFLDLGTGTGFASIVISQRAGLLLATDCSASAVQCAKRNFKRFGVHAEVRTSDMFDRVAETFDYIVFNPPVHAHETELDRRCKNGLKRLFPTAFNHFASVFARPVFKHSIRSVIRIFYLEACRHLNPGGTMFVNTLSPDISWLSDWIAGDARLRVCRHSGQFCIVAITPFESITRGVEGDQEYKPSESNVPAGDID